MEYHAQSKTLEFTEAMKSHVELQVETLGTYLNDLNGRAVLRKEGPLFVLELTMDGVRGSSTGEDFYDLTREVVEKIERQIKKSIGIRQYKPSKKANFKEFVGELSLNPELVEEPVQREKHLVLEEITDREAIEELELLGHDFYVYKDIDRSGNTCVLYKRRNGTYGVIVTK
jgi:putative sigma-54 modulation protein